LEFAYGFGGDFEGGLAMNVYEFHVISRACHHSDDTIYVTAEIKGVGSHIVHSLKPSRKDFDTIDVKEGLVLDARLLEEVL
jgi:hypothetical protein